MIQAYVNMYGYSENPVG